MAYGKMPERTRKGRQCLPVHGQFPHPLSPLPFLTRHPMNLPFLPSEVLSLAAHYPSWQPFPSINPPWSSKPHHPSMTILPPITSLQRQYHYIRLVHLSLPHKSTIFSRMKNINFCTFPLFYLPALKKVKKYESFIHIFLMNHAIS
jgi:hypothetical protein